MAATRTSAEPRARTADGPWWRAVSMWSVVIPFVIGATATA
jgi:hypothetical protein